MEALEAAAVDPSSAMDPVLREQVLEALDAAREGSEERLRGVGDWAEPLRALVEEAISLEIEVLRAWVGEKLFEMDPRPLDCSWAAHQAAAYLLGDLLVADELHALASTGEWLDDTTSSFASFAVSDYMHKDTPAQRHEALFALLHEDRPGPVGNQAMLVTPRRPQHPGESLEAWRAAEWVLRVEELVEDAIVRAERFQDELTRSDLVRLVVLPLHADDFIGDEPLARAIRSGAVHWGREQTVVIVPDAIGAYLGRIGKASQPRISIPPESMEIVAAICPDLRRERKLVVDDYLQAALDTLR